MTESGLNLLTQPLFTARPHGKLTLPGLLAALASDEVDALPALRPHQEPALFMFLVQLAALALLAADAHPVPDDEDRWRDFLRKLTRDFPDDEPWHLAVEDRRKPAFLQAPVPDDVKLSNSVPTPDALDLLITSKNHDLKQSIAHTAEPEDWAFALISLQTSEGYGGKENNGIARMNRGYSSRACMYLAPLPGESDKGMSPRPGAAFKRNVELLLDTRQQQLAENPDYPETGGLGLVWLRDWPQDAQLEISQLDIWFIEICRRIRLGERAGQLSAYRGTSKATRINAKHLNGALGDPFAPVHKTENKSLTLGARDFGYRLLADLLFGDWNIPVLAHPTPLNDAGTAFALTIAALARGKSGTEGFKSRTIPLPRDVATRFDASRDVLGELAKAQLEDIRVFDRALSLGLALMAAEGSREKLSREHYRHALPAQAALDRQADAIYFDHLWRRFRAQGMGHQAVGAKQLDFARELRQRSNAIFEAASPAIPCASLFRPRAEARARSAFNATIWKTFPELFERSALEDHHDAA